MELNMGSYVVTILVLKIVDGASGIQGDVNVGQGLTQITAPNTGSVPITVHESPTTYNFAPIRSGPTSYAKLVTGESSRKDDQGKPLAKKVGYGTNSLLEQWKETYENDDYDFDPYDDDMYERHDILDKIQSICDNLDIKVRGQSSRKSVNFHTLTPLVGIEADVAIPLESIRAISEQFVNTTYRFFLEKLVAYLVFSFEDGLDAMLENGSWSSYDRSMIDLRVDEELKDTIVVAMPKLVGEGFKMCTIHVEYEWKPPRCSSCMVFGHILNECPKKIISDVVKNLNNPRQATRGVQQDELSRQEISNLNPFDALNSIENDDDL
ncbi:ribonuclease H-like domain-containing protein, partial [Tanacetum coccineum]